MPPKQLTGVRVLCGLENASTSINGKAFATVAIGDAPLHLSERMDLGEAERFTKIPGYTVWDGDEAPHARRIEDALDRVTRTAPQSSGPRPIETELRQQLDEQRRSNRAQANEIRKLELQVEQLTTSNTALSAEIAQLKAAGIKPVDTQPGAPLPNGAAGTASRATA